MAVKKVNGKSDGWHQFYRHRRFRILLVILVALLVGSPLLVGFGLSADWYDGLMLLVLLAAILPFCFEHRQRMLAIFGGIPTIALFLAANAFSEDTNRSVLFVGHLCAVLFFFGSAALIVGTLFKSRSLTVDSVFGAVCGYLFLGIAWAMSYSMLDVLNPDSFAVSDSLPDADVQSQPYILLYYSFVTLTTLGYGDVVPISPTSRTLAWIQAITGQFYLAIVVASLIGFLVAKAQKSAKGEDIHSP